MYRTSYGEAFLRQAPDPEAAQIGVIPANTVVEVIEQESYWVKVKSYEGWVPATVMERLMETPAPDIQCQSNGHKVFDGQYRNFFGLNNVGLANYAARLTFRLYARSGLVDEVVFDYTNDPIYGPGWRALHIDTAKEIKRVEIEGKGVFWSGPTVGPRR